MADEQFSERPREHNGAADAAAIHVAALDELSPRQLYGILQLRVQVFSVEQDCAYQDLDGQDLSPEALQLWQEEGDQVVSTLRILRADEDRVIGRVVTAPTHRRQGRSAQLMRHGITLCGGHAINVSAQAHLEHWYERFGFVRHGGEYLEDGIPHVAMRRPATH